MSSWLSRAPPIKASGDGIRQPLFTVQPCSINLQDGRLDDLINPTVSTPIPPSEVTLPYVYLVFHLFFPFVLSTQRHTSGLCRIPARSAYSQPQNTKPASSSSIHSVNNRLAAHPGFSPCLCPSLWTGPTRTSPISTSSRAKSSYNFRPKPPLEAFRSSSKVKVARDCQVRNIRTMISPIRGGPS